MTAVSCSRRQDGGSPVEKARKLVHDLSNLEEKTAESIWSDRPSGSKLPFKAEEPAPLEYYLKQVRDTKSSPYPKLGKSHRSRSSSPSKSTARVSKQLNTSYTVVKDTYGDARNVLHSVVTERETLEKNLEMMLRSRQDADEYSLIGEIASDRPEITRIQKIVEKRISSLRNEVKREVEWDLQHNVPATKSASAQEVGRRPGRGASSKAAVGFGSGAPRMSRIDTGLHKSRSVPDTVSAAGKENRIVKAKPAPRKSKIPYEDEGAMTQIYGKAQYQKGRTTVKDPYLHFQNQTKHRNSRLPSPKRTGDVIDVKSFKAQAGGVTSVHSAGQIEGGKPRQYYFSPTRGYIPLSSEATGPVGGQLVPMAVPLGKPRMDPGLAVVPDDRQQSVSLGVSRPGRSVVTAATNVAMVSVTAQAEQVVRDRVPELGKQVLPAVDIDSLSPASTPCGSDIDIKDPMTSQNAGYLQTFHYQESEEEEEGDKTLTEETSDEEQQGTGISLPGYHQPTPARGGNIPDKATQAAHLADRASQLREQGEVPWEERCDELAEDLRSRDVLQNKAKYWLEQELMARMLMKMYPVMSAQAEQEAEQQQEEDVADGSDSIPDDESLLVGDTIGQRGLQLFVDAGQPVNNKLVNALVREVIAEKVSSILGRRQEIDAADSRTMAAKSRTRPATGGTMVNDEEVIMATNIPNRQPAQVPTPQPTPPCTSPVPGFGAHEIPATPPLTPPPPPLPPRERSPVKDISSESSAPAAVMVSAATSMTAQLEPLPVPQAVPVVYESESEVSASLDISEEIRALEAQMKQAQAASVTQSCHDVRTPTATPPPSPPLPISKERPMATPPASPPSHPAEPVKPSAPVVPQEVPSQERSSKSPQPWGNPDSPGPELNPNYEEPSDVHHSQPQPLMMSVAVGTDRLKEPRRSPSPQRRRTYSTDHSELDSVSSPSSCTDTFNENVSEGQWLISEGQVAGLPPGEEWYHKAVEAVRKMDTSTASTLRDTEDLELDETDIVHSEGEVLSKAGMVNPEKDPVLGLIMQMQRQPGAFRQFDIPAQQVQHVLASTGRSVGEVGRSGGYAAVRRSVGELSEGQVLPGNQVTVVAPKTASAPYPGDEGTDYRQQGDMGMQEADRSLSPGPRRQANSVPRSKTPPGTRNRQQQYQPVRSGLPPSQARRPLKSALVRSSEDSRHSRDSEQEFERRGPPTEYGTRTLTPDQLNTDVLLQSGTYMTRSMGSSGRQGSTKKSVEFDLSGTYEMSRKGSYRGSDDGFNSTAGSSERLSGSGRSLGLKYSFEDSESHREMPSSGLRMSVTIPTTEGASDSDISEIDISESTGI